MLEGSKPRTLPTMEAAVSRQVFPGSTKANASWAVPKNPPPNPNEVEGSLGWPFALEQNDFGEGASGCLETMALLGAAAITC